MITKIEFLYRGEGGWDVTLVSATNDCKLFQIRQPTPRSYTLHNVRLVRGEWVENERFDGEHGELAALTFIITRALDINGTAPTAPAPAADPTKSKEYTALLDENTALRKENTKLKDRIKVLEDALRANQVFHTPLQKARRPGKEWDEYEADAVKRTLEVLQ